MKIDDDLIIISRKTLGISLDEVENFLQDAIQELSNRVSDFPAATCPLIDYALKDLKPVLADAKHLMHENDFADSVDTQLSGLPDLLEDLRRENSQLRSSLTEALQSRKDAVDSLTELSVFVDNIRGLPLGPFEHTA